MSYPEMTLKEYNSIPFNNKTTFEEGMYVRLQDSAGYIGSIATYYQRTLDNKGNRVLKPYNVQIVKDE